MDTTLGTAELAAAFGSSVPRVHRAVRGGVVTPVGTSPRGGLRFAPSALEQLRALWGCAPAVPGLTREQVLLLAALARRPLGLRSARAAARASGVSPTTASAALGALLDAGYVTRLAVRAVERRVVDLHVWSVAWRSCRWQAVAALVGTAILPVTKRRSRPRGVPARLWHLFWDTDPSRLDPAVHGAYIAERILRSSDSQALAWLVAAVPPAALKAAARRRGLSKGQRRLALALAAAP